MKLFQCFFVQLLLSLKIFSIANGSPANTERSLSCLIGPNYGSDLDESYDLRMNECHSSQTFCLRVEAGLRHLNKPNATVTNVVVGKCVEKQKCNSKLCEQFLSDFFSIKYTSPPVINEETSGDSFSEGQYVGGWEPAFDVRYCQSECCAESFCNEATIAQIRKTETTTKKGGGGNASSAVSSEPFILFVLLIFSLSLLSSLH